MEDDTITWQRGDGPVDSITSPTFTVPTGGFTLNFTRETSVREGQVADCRYTMFIDGDGRDWQFRIVVVAKAGRHVRDFVTFTIPGARYMTLDEAIARAKQLLKQRFHTDR